MRNPAVNTMFGYLAALADDSLGDMLIRFLLRKSKNCPSWCWVLLSGVLVGLNAPGRHTQLVGMASLFPLFLVMDRIGANHEAKWKRKLWHILIACWGAGSVAALIAAPWLSYAARVFGGFSRPVALLITGLGYGAEVTLVLFVCFAVPTLFIRRRGCWEILVRLSYFLAVDPYCPRVFDWSFGGITFTRFPWLCQLADVIGSGGLGMYSIGFSLLLLLIWRWKVEGLPVPIKTIRRLVASYLILWASGLSYGAWRTHSLQSYSGQGTPLHVAAVQPNLSFQELASSAAHYSVRQRSVHQLLQDSARALGRFPADSGIPKLVVWPESVYPSPYFKDSTFRPLIEDFLRSHRASLLLHSIDWDETALGRKYYGIAVLIGPDGRVKGRYNKIFRIPFGEYIPGADLFPAYANWLREHVANLSEFDKGKEFTVFRLPDDVRFSAPICFDIFSPSITRNMSRGGAELAINLCNLIWFGRTNASDNLQMTVRWRAIENRIPILLASNNGESVLINALGASTSEELPLFEKGIVSCTIFLRRHFCLYRDYTGWVHATFLSLLVLTAVAGHSRGKIYARTTGSQAGSMTIRE